MKSKIIILLALILVVGSSTTIKAQSAHSDWPQIPGFGPESPLTLTSEENFYVVMGGAALSYVLAEYVFPDSTNLHFYNARIGVNNEYVWGLRNVFLQNVGVENRVAPWFAFALEFNLQEWSDRTPEIEGSDKFGIGLGIMTYYRWYVLGKKRIAPYLEYGTGLFLGTEAFPYNGSAFTFSHSTQLGIEYRLDNQDRIRLGYGQFHQSNNGWAEKNPGYDASGFSISYAKFWK